MVIQHNMGAMNTSRMLKINNKNLSKRMEKLSSGYSVNRAADDAAGLSISEKMRNLIRNLNMASQNAEDGISLLQTADGALSEVHSILHRIEELSTKAANDVNCTEDRQASQDEINSLVGEIDRIADTTAFNGLKLLDGSFDHSATFSKGAGDVKAITEVTASDGLQSVNKVTVKNPVIDTSATANIGSTKANNLQNELVDSIVPQAVNAFLDTFTAFKTAADNNQVSDEIGLKLYSDNSTTLAFVSIKYGYFSDGTLASDAIALNLSVNTNTLTFDGDELSADSRLALENTIVHEMMHAFMDDTLINGMIGAVDGKLDSSNEFPSWFTEGMAQSAVGGCANTNDWVNSSLGLTENSTEAEISDVVKNNANSLSSGSTSSEYGTGYLACMYLGYMAAGSPATITDGDMDSGLNTILEKLMSGTSLDDVINEISGGLYTDTTDFENKFGDAQSTAFTSNLLTLVGSTGNGGVVGNLADSDLLPDQDATSTVYQANTSSDYIVSSVGDDRNWTSGGRGQTGGTTGNTPRPGGSGGGIIFGKAFYLQVGGEAGQDMSLNLKDMHARILGVDNLSVMSHESASDAMTACYNAVKKVSESRSQIGAYINRLEYTIANLDNYSENLQNAESRIRDTDMAEEMTEYSLQSILSQAAQAMLSQATQNPESVLALL